MVLDFCSNHVKCEGPNVAKEEIKVTKVAQRTFGGTTKWVRFLDIFKWNLIFH